MKWVDHPFAQPYMNQVRTLWETIFHFEAEEGAYQRFIHTARLEELQVPEGCNHNNEDFKLGRASLEELIDMLKKSQHRYVEQQSTKRAPGEDVLELDAAKRKKRPKKIDDTARDKG